MNKEPMYSVKMSPADYQRWQDARGNVEDATAILETVKRQRDAQPTKNCGDIMPHAPHNWRERLEGGPFDLLHLCIGSHE